MALVSRPLVSVCVCTYKRPELLSQLLNSLAVQQRENFAMEIVVVDNDSSGSAQCFVARFSGANPGLAVVYAIEPRQGISFARNRTVELATGDYLAFIDDDERARVDWLSQLYDCLRVTDADAVFGPVLPVFPDGSKLWAIESAFFDRPRFEDCSQITSGYTRTSNALIASSWAIKRTPHCFSEALAWSGGEDHDFFRWMESGGARLIWSDRAIVEEIVPLKRQSFSFILERSFRTSTTYWRGVNAARPSWHAVAEALKGLLGGFAFLLPGAVVFLISRAVSARLLAKAAKGFGRVAAMSDLRLVGYGKKK